jgi:ankyrin repeat protein
MELQQWINVENLIFEAKWESIEKAKPLLPQFSQEQVYNLIIDVAEVRPFSFKILGDLFKELKKPEIIFWRGIFPTYLYSRGILTTNNFDRTPELDRTIEEYENPFINDSLVYSVTTDNLESFVFHSTSQNVTKNVIKFENKNVSFLDFAAICGAVKIFKYLIINVCEITRKTVLCSIRGGNEDIIQLLEQKDFSFDETFSEAIKYHNNSIAFWLYDNYIYNDVRLTDCVRSRNTEMFLFLYKKGRKIDEFDLHKRTPLSHAAHDGLLTLAKFLVDNGANINSRDRYGQTPLLHAKLENRKEVMEFLKSKGAREV